MTSVDFLTFGRGVGADRASRRYQAVLPALATTIPYAKLVVTPEMDHNAPDLGAPAAVARLIRA